jgi:peptide/nickel transport system substrate-binding protein
MTERHTLPTKLHVVAFFLLSLVAFALISCGRNDGEAQTLVIAVETSPLTFDPRGPTNAVTARIQQLIFNTLTQKNDQFEIVPELAESWEVSEDLRTYTFHIRKGVRFQTGQEMTARDVAYTFTSLLAPDFDSPKRAALSRLSRVEATEPYTVVFHLREPYRGLLVDLVAIGIIPENSGPTIAAQPVGTGPFKLDAYVENQEVSLTAFPEYFQGAPQVHRLRVKIIRDSTTLSLELLGGTVQFVLNAQLSPDFVVDQQKSQNLSVLISNGAGVEYLGVNTTDPILRDPRVRQAIAYGINREAIIKNLLRGQAKIASTVLPLSHWAYHSGVKQYEHDPDLARRLLDDAGRRDPDGPGPQPRFHLTLKTSSSEVPRKIATALLEQLRQIGIELRLESYEMQTFLNDINSGNFQLFFLRQIGANQFTDIFKAAFGSRSIPGDRTIRDSERTGFLNRARYRNPALNDLIGQAEMAHDQRELLKIFGQIQEMLAEDLPWIYLWYPSNIAVMSRQVGDVTVPTSGDFQFLRSVMLRQ